MEMQTSRVREIWIPLLSTIVALAGVMSGVWIQNKRLNADVELKQFEVTFLEKQKSYASFMLALSDTFNSAYQQNPIVLRQQIERLETTFFAMEPFLKSTPRTDIWNHIRQFQGLCLSLVENLKKGKDTRKDSLDSYLWYKNWFHNKLFGELFYKTDI